MRTAQELRELLTTAPGSGLDTGALIRELVDDLIARREADETRAVEAEAAALRARVFSECRAEVWSSEAGANHRLIHVPSGIQTASTVSRDAALESLMTALRAQGAI